MAGIYTRLTTMYKHTQQSTFLLGFFILLAFAVAVPIMMSGVRSSQIFGIGTGLLILGVAATFSRMTIQVDDHTAQWAFAAGMLQKSIDLKDVLSATPTRTTLVDGVGVHWGSRGTVYNVSMGDAVLITMRDKNKNFLLGSNEPIELANAIHSRLGGAP